jgi:hypothetical protein
VRSCRISRARTAPRERRIPISLCLAIARASIMFATFAHASSSTRPKAATSGLNTSRSSGVNGIAVALEIRRTPVAFRSSGSWHVIRRDHVSSAASVLEILCPCLIRPMMLSRSGYSIPKRSGPSSKRPAIVTGAQKSRGTSLKS